MPTHESIFISYRRSDSVDAVALINRELTDYFGKGQVFLDQDSIGYGISFPDRIKPAVENCKVMPVVIGPTWLSVTDDGGIRRLDTPDDWVRQEIELALKNKLYVIPVLLNGAAMPSKGELPQSIQELSEINACHLTTRQSTRLFKAGVEEIITTIEGNVLALKPPPPITLVPFEFRVVTLEVQKGLLGGRKVIEQSQKREAKQYIEDVGNGVWFEMVYIPEGSFIMGAPASEEESVDKERPQHKVTVQPFLMGKYPITQQLWRTVAGLPKVERELNPDPSNFKGDTRPIEQVSWHDAIEFCARLSRFSGKLYRLPTEAEWEYACRAGTSTPFHFGETITTDLANYRGTAYGDRSGSYRQGPKGIFREGTAPVGSCGVANAFGLYDMHGNVMEWCADHWHDNYEGAPTDGSAWLNPNSKIERHIRRGGCWFYDPGTSRSAARFEAEVGCRSYLDGFRIACSLPKNLQ